MPRCLALLPTLLLTALALAGCGGKEETLTAPRTEALRVVLDYLPNADHAGLYAADFASTGLDVDLQPPPDAASPLGLLTAGKADLAVTYEPELLLARAKGEDLVAVGALVQKPLNAIISLGAVRTPADLRGKTVGVSGLPSDAALLRSIATKANVPYDSIKQVQVGFNLSPALLSDKVDAILGAYWNIEAVELARRGEKPVVLRLEQIGVPEYAELVLVATRQTAQRRGALLRRFLQAAARGHEALREDPRAGVQGLLRAVPDLREEVVLEQVRATLPVFFPADREKPWGFMDSTAFASFAQWMFANDLLEKRIDGADALTTEFLPGEGAQPAEQAGPAGAPKLNLEEQEPGR